MSDERFLSRWARRKRDAARGATTPEPAPPPVASAAPVAADSARAEAVPARGTPGAAQEGAGSADPGSPAREAARGETPEAPEPLPDPSSLTPADDFTPFMRAEVSAEQRNAALKRLFTDPHFNTMDGLDIYIDDYSKPDPIPPAMLATLRHARGLLARDDAAPRDPRSAGEGGEGGEGVRPARDPSEAPDHDAAATVTRSERPDGGPPPRDDGIGPPPPSAVAPVDGPNASRDRPDAPGAVQDSDGASH